MTNPDQNQNQMSLEVSDIRAMIGDYVLQNLAKDKEIARLHQKIAELESRPVASTNSVREFPVDQVKER